MSCSCCEGKEEPVPLARLLASVSVRLARRNRWNRCPEWYQGLIYKAERPWGDVIVDDACKGQNGDLATALVIELYRAKSHGIHSNCSWSFCNSIAWLRLTILRSLKSDRFQQPQKRQNLREGFALNRIVLGLVHVILLDSRRFITHSSRGNERRSRLITASGAAQQRPIIAKPGFGVNE